MAILNENGLSHTIEKIISLLKGKSNTDHKHTKSDITDFPTLGTASSKDVASSGNASASQVVMGNDTRLSDARKASDVYPWAKASTKPSYTASEVGAYTKTETDTKLNGKANSSHTHGNGDITSLDAGKITSGTISIDRLPQGALDRLIKVVDDTARFKLTTKDVQLGDSVKVTSTKKMYIVVDETKLSSEDGYEPYTADSATSVPWSGVTGKPSTYTPSSHTHTKSQITDFPTSMPASDVYSWAKQKTKPTYTASEIGLGSVGNFKAVSTVQSQGLTDAEKANARANIGAGTSSFSGSYNDLTNKPTIPTKVGELTNDKDYATKTEVTKAIDDIQIGGRNLLPNSNFELPGKPNWFNLSAHAYITNEGRNSGYCAKQIGKFNENHSLLNSASLKVKANDIFTFSGWYKVQAYIPGTTNNFVRPYVEYHKSDNAWLSETAILSISPDATDWTYVKASFKVPNIQEIDHMNFILYARDYTGIIWWDDLKLEKGNKATDWTPAQEDTVYDDTGVQKRISDNGYGEVAGGKNLLNHNIIDSKIKNCSVLFKNDTFYATNKGNYSLFTLSVPTIVGKSYIVTIKDWSDYSYRCIASVSDLSDNTLVSMVINDATLSMTFTAVGTESLIQISPNNTPNEMSNTITFKCMLEEGSVATEYEPYFPSNKMLAEEKADRKETTVNLLKPTLGTTTQNGVTCTNNGDGTYTFNGTATAETTFIVQIIGNIIEKYANKDLWLAGCPKNGSMNTYRQHFWAEGQEMMFDTGSGTKFRIENTTKNANIAIIIEAGVTVDNIVFKPMITTNLNATYDDFVAYTGDSGKLNSDVAKLNSDLSGKANSSHTHNIDEIGTHYINTPCAVHPMKELHIPKNLNTTKTITITQYVARGYASDVYYNYVKLRLNLYGYGMYEGELMCVMGGSETSGVTGKLGGTLSQAAQYGTFTWSSTSLSSNATGSGGYITHTIKVTGNSPIDIIYSGDSTVSVKLS